jgi:glycosyltransferase involved in cell wall biosynthesis
MYRGKTFKWGYFPEVGECDIENIIREKSENSVLWCGRFIDWKHPDDAVEAVNNLIKKGYNLQVKFIGTGDMEDSLKARVKELGIENYINFLGSMSPDKVREHMKKSRIHLVTSDFKEGWGAVVNEAMASGCAVVASHSAGSVPYLIDNEENGLIYESGNVDELSQKIENLLKDSVYCSKLGKNAYETISKLWNAEVAADRLLELIDAIRNGKNVNFISGPCSVAKPLKNNWIKNNRAK